MLSHIKSHWVKYYVIAGVAYAGYKTFGPGGEPFDAMNAVKRVAFWPAYLTGVL